MAFNLGDILLTIKANTDSLKKGLSDVQDMGTQTKSLGSKIQSGLNTAAAGLAVVGVGLTAYAKNATDYTVQAVKNAKQLATTIGTTTTEASRLTAAVERMGLSEQDANQIFGIFSKNISAQTANTEQNRLAQQKLQIQIDQTKLEIKDTTAEIAKNGDATGQLHLKLMDLNNTLATHQNALGATQTAFDKLGVSTVDSTGKQKDFQTILFETADKFQQMPDGIEKTTTAQELFGRSGKDMIKILNLGSDGIKDLEEKADKLGLTLNEKTIGAVSALVTQQKDLKEKTDAVKIAVGTATTPVLTKYYEWINKITEAALNASPAIKGMATNVLAFGGPVASGASATAGFLGNISSIGPKLGAFLLKLGLWGIVIGGVALALFELQKNFGIFDDLGGKIERVWNRLNDLYGLTTIVAQFWQQVMLPAIMAIWSAIYQNLWPAVEQLWDAMVRLYNALQPGLSELLKLLAVLIGATLFVAIWLALSALNVIIQVFSMVVSAVSNVINWLANLIGWFGNVAGVVWNTIKTIVDILWNFPSAAKDVVGAVISLFGALGGQILRSLGNMASLLYQAGRDLIGGFVKGIKDTVGDVTSAVGNVGSSAVSKMKSLLGIHSPSTVFKAIGNFLGGGLVQGIMGTVKDVQNAMSALLQPTGISALPDMAFSTGSLLTGAQNGNGEGTTTTNNNSPTHITQITGPVSIASPSDAGYLFDLQNRNQDLESMGLSPAL